MFDFTKEPGRIHKKKYETNCGKVCVSMITAYYNASKYIMQTAFSVLNQTFPFFEWIIVNDGSNSECEKKVLEDVCKLDQRIKVIHQENAGATAARMNGIQNSKADIIVILDADDLIDERFLEYTYIALRQNPKAMWAFVDSVGFGDQEYLWKPEFSSDGMKKENLLVYCAAIRKKVFLEDKLYDTSTKNEWEDYQFWLKMLAKGYTGIHVRQNLFWYRRLATGELSKIERNPEIKDRLLHTIEELAQSVPNGIRAIEPYDIRGDEFAKPYSWNWEFQFPNDKNKISILFFFPHMECGGADKFNLDILENIDKEKFECSIITTINNPSEWRQKFQEVADNIFELPSFLSMQDWPAFIHYFIVSRNINIVCNISSYYAYYLFPWLRTEFPDIALIDCVHADAPYWRNGGYTRTSAAIGSISELTYVTNEYTRNLMVEKYGVQVEKTKVIHTGVDERVFEPSLIDDQCLREKFGVVHDKFTVLYLCRMAPEKRPFLLLEIARRIEKIDDSIQFLLVGGGEQLEEIKEYVRVNGMKNVIITGRQEDIKPFYKMSDLFVLCSLMEGLSVTTFEAMAMGIPVVSADVGSQFELVSDKTGKLITCRQDGATELNNRNFAEKEIEEYIDAILSISKDKEKHHQLKENCIQKIKDGFTLSCLIETLENDFTALVSDEAKKSRREIWKKLAMYKDMAIDYLSVYVEYENTCRSVGDIWNSCQYEISEKQKYMTIAEERDRLLLKEREEKEQYIAKLEKIYSMPSWKMLQKFRKTFVYDIIYAFYKVIKKIRRMA